MDQIAQPLGRVLQSGIGDTILTINSSMNLPNAFGKADVFGRTTPTGLITIQYLGRNGSVAHFLRKGLVINTGATTLNSTPIIIPNTSTSYTSGTIGTVPVSGSTTTYGPPTVIPARPPEPQVLPQEVVAIDLDLAREDSFIISGKRIVVVNATMTSVTYRIEQP